MFFRRRHHCPLLRLVLLVLGVRVIRHKCGGQDEAGREEFKAKAKEFRGKMKEAFAVWQEEPEAAEAGAGADANAEAGK